MGYRCQKLLLGKPPRTFWLWHLASVYTCTGQCICTHTQAHSKHTQIHSQHTQTHNIHEHTHTHKVKDCPLYFLVCLFICLLLVFQGNISQCSFGACPRTHCVDQTGIKLTELFLTLPPECWDSRHVLLPPSIFFHFLKALKFVLVVVICFFLCLFMYKD